MQKKKPTNKTIPLLVPSADRHRAAAAWVKSNSINFSSSIKQSPDVNWLLTVKTEELWIHKKEER